MSSLASSRIEKNIMTTHVQASLDILDYIICHCAKLDTCSSYENIQIGFNNVESLAPSLYNKHSKDHGKYHDASYFLFLLAQKNFARKKTPLVISKSPFSLQLPFAVRPYSDDKSFCLQADEYHNSEGTSISNMSSEKNRSISALHNSKSDESKSQKTLKANSEMNSENRKHRDFRKLMNSLSTAAISHATAGKYQLAAEKAATCIACYEKRFSGDFSPNVRILNMLVRANSAVSFEDSLSVIEHFQKWDLHPDGATIRELLRAIAVSLNKFVQNEIDRSLIPIDKHLDISNRQRLTVAEYLNQVVSIMYQFQIQIGQEIKQVYPMLQNHIRDQFITQYLSFDDGGATRQEEIAYNLSIQSLSKRVISGDNAACKSCIDMLIEMREKQLRIDSHVYSISMIALQNDVKKGNIRACEDSLSLLHEMFHTCSEIPESSLRCVMSALITKVKCRYDLNAYKEGLEILDALKNRGKIFPSANLSQSIMNLLAVTSETLNSQNINAAAISADLTQKIDKVMKDLTDGLTPNVGLINAVVKAKGCVSLETLCGTLSLFTKYSISPDRFTMSHILNALARFAKNCPNGSPSASVAQCLHDFFEKHNLKLNATHNLNFNSIGLPQTISHADYTVRKINAKMERILARMVRETSSIRIVKQADFVIAEWRAIKRCSTLNPTLVSYNYVLEALSAKAQHADSPVEPAQEALAVLNQMRLDNNVLPTGVAYSMAMRALLHAGHFGEVSAYDTCVALLHEVRGSSDPDLTADINMYHVGMTALQFKVSLGFQDAADECVQLLGEALTRGDLSVRQSLFNIAMRALSLKVELGFPDACDECKQIFGLISDPASHAYVALMDALANKVRLGHLEALDECFALQQSLRAKYIVLEKPNSSPSPSSLVEHSREPMVEADEESFSSVTTTRSSLRTAFHPGGSPTNRGTLIGESIYMKALAYSVPHGRPDSVQKCLQSLADLAIEDQIKTGTYALNAVLYALANDVEIGNINSSDTAQRIANEYCDKFGLQKDEMMYCNILDGIANRAKLGDQNAHIHCLSVLEQMSSRPDIPQPNVPSVTNALRALSAATKRGDLFALDKSFELSRSVRGKYSKDPSAFGKNDLAFYNTAMVALTNFIPHVEIKELLKLCCEMSKAEGITRKSDDKLAEYQASMLTTLDLLPALPTITIPYVYSGDHPNPSSVEPEKKSKPMTPWDEIAWECDELYSLLRQLDRGAPIYRPNIYTLNLLVKARGLRSFEEAYSVLNEFESLNLTPNSWTVLELIRVLVRERKRESHKSDREAFKYSENESLMCIAKLIHRHNIDPLSYSSQVKKATFVRDIDLS